MSSANTELLAYYGRKRGYAWLCLLVSHGCSRACNRLRAVSTLCKAERFHPFAMRAPHYLLGFSLFSRPCCLLCCKEVLLRVRETRGNAANDKKKHQKVQRGDKIVICQTVGLGVGILLYSYLRTADISEASAERRERSSAVSSTYKT